MPTWLLFSRPRSTALSPFHSGVATMLPGKRVALIEHVGPEIAIQVGGIRSAVVALHRQSRGDRRVVLALPVGVGEVELIARS